jgi:hypothetical protein
VNAYSPSVRIASIITSRPDSFEGGRSWSAVADGTSPQSGTSGEVG